MILLLLASIFILKVENRVEDDHPKYHAIIKQVINLFKADCIFLSDCNAKNISQKKSAGLNQAFSG